MPDAPEPPLFPVGPFYRGRRRPTIGCARAWIDALERAPAAAQGGGRRASRDGAFDTAYRNWTIRQIVHHLADSHLNSYVRFKLALTEDRPTIKPYDESRWSDLPDAQRADVELSLRLLDALHGRWIYLLRSLAPEAFDRSFYHPGPARSCPCGARWPTTRGMPAITRRRSSGCGRTNFRARDRG